MRFTNLHAGGNPAPALLRLVSLVFAATIPLAAQAADPRIGVGADFVVVSRTDGSLWAWGLGNDGQLGNGTRNSSSRPVRVANLSGVVDVVAADGMTAALKADGTVWVFGSGAFGIFGSTQPGNTIRATAPVQIPELQGVRALAVGRNGASAFALDTSGRVFNWGTNSSGQAGTGVAGGNAEVRSLPQLVPGLSGVSAIAAGDNTFIATTTAGAVFGWGYNQLGALGVTSLTTPGGQPLAVLPIDNTGDAVALALMDVNDNAHFALRRDGSVSAWGTNSGAHAGCGQGSAVGATLTTPRVVQNLGDVLALAAGTAHGLFLSQAGNVLTCGSNTSGALGDGSTQGVDAITKPGPIRAALPVAAQAIGAGRNMSAAIGRDGSTWVWGSVANGAAGDGGAVAGVASQRAVLTPQAVAAEAAPGLFNAGVGATAPALYVGTQTGSLERATVSVGLAPAAEDVGRSGRVYLVALLPDGSFYANAAGASWVPWVGGPIPVFAAGRLERHLPIPLFLNADLRPYAGISLYTGYGVGETDAAAQSDMLSRVKYGAATTLR